MVSNNLKRGQNGMKPAAGAAKPVSKSKKAQINLKPSREGWLIAAQLMDTTWRVALPILLLCYIGIQIDKHNTTTPAFTLIGLFLSLALSTILVYRQIKALYPDFFKGDRL